MPDSLLQHICLQPSVDAFDLHLLSSSLQKYHFQTSMFKGQRSNSVVTKLTESASWKWCNLLFFVCVSLCLWGVNEKAISSYYDAVYLANTNTVHTEAHSWCKDSVMSVISVLHCDLPCVPSLVNNRPGLRGRAWLQPVCKQLIMTQWSQWAGLGGMCW